MHAFRTFLGDDEDISNWPGGVSYEFFLSVCGLDFLSIHGVVPCFSYRSALAIRVGGRVACLVVVFATFAGTWFSILDIH